MQLHDPLHGCDVDIVPVGPDHYLLLDECGEPMAEGSADEATRWAGFLGLVVTQ